jgi:hypothetical protein
VRALPLSQLKEIRSKSLIRRSIRLPLKTLKWIERLGSSVNKPKIATLLPKEDSIYSWTNPLIVT